MALNIDDFKAKLKGGGARANLFRVTVNFPSYAAGDVELTSFMCSAASLPQSAIAVVEVPFRGRQLKVAGDRTFDPITLTFLNDTDFAVRNAFERWMNGINTHVANTGILAPSEYQADMIIEQLDRQDNVIKTYDVRGAFPTNVAAIDLANASNDEIESFTVEFQVQYWESNTTS
jgi:hypothetical protein